MEGESRSKARYDLSDIIALHHLVTVLGFHHESEILNFESCIMNHEKE